MDCEFGMDYIQKFRSDRVREDSMDNHNHRMSGPSACGVRIVAKTTMELMPLVSDQIDEEELCESLSGLTIIEDAEPQTKQLKQTEMSTWPRPDSQIETRPCSPESHTEELNSYTILPAVLKSNGFVDLMPSTSAQARALALAMHQQQPSSVSSSPLSSSHRSSVRPYPEYSPSNTPPIADPFSGTPLTQFNFTYIHSTESPQPAPPPPPPPSPMFSNSFSFGHSNPLANLPHLAGKENGNIQFNQFDACAEDYSPSGPSNYR
ncbi:palladin-like [Drosophila innubila]|uniref:palladin-like n=1 Tax=Drosophila innubila TaxID=198719 RepID=UPI00148BA37A|nr:palladin-like [Drosophila innubila]